MGRNRRARRDYLLSLLALGFDPDEGTLYRQSDNDRLQRLAFELGGKANFSEFQSIYGFDGETNVSHMQSVVTQMADILYPQLDDPKPTVIPVGPDQDPHMRLARDLAARMRYFGVTEAFASFEADGVERTLLRQAYDAREEYAEDADRPRCGEAADWLRDHQPAPADARESIVAKLDEAGKEPLRPRIGSSTATPPTRPSRPSSKPSTGRNGCTTSTSTPSTGPRRGRGTRSPGRTDHGGYGFQPPSSIYHRFMTGLTGGKMSSSIPASHISLLDDPEDGYDKVKSATTGGRSTAEEQREIGGEADECPVYELYAYLLTGDDDELAKEVYDECVGGERLCGGCKEQAAS